MALDQKKEIEIENTISLLINSIYYFLEFVFIIASEGDYRLFVLNDNHVILDKHYKTFEDARMAFKRYFSARAYKKWNNAEWSHFYPVDKKWLRDKLNHKHMDA